MAGDNKDAPPAAAERTIFIPAEAFAFAAGAPPAAGAEPAVAHRAVQVGDVLSQMFEVIRSVGKGRLGEVFEGVNVTSKERVAIKALMPAIASDAPLLAVFRREAWSLTRLNTPVVAQYRVLAQDPDIGAFYIVSEFIDGTKLSEALPDLDVSSVEVVQLIKRLATGLAAAHALDAVHQDLSTDNIILEGGKFQRARIIDFGLAKDLSESTKTVIDNSFAGKLRYVAPEQLGDFDRTIGPWTDIYSLGLVALAVATGREPDMAGSLVQAVDKRRKGPDLTDVAEELHPLFERMLTPDPKLRLRSMEELIDLLPAVTAQALARLADATEEPKRPAPAPARAQPAPAPAPAPAPKPVAAEASKPAPPVIAIKMEVGAAKPDPAEGGQPTEAPADFGASTVPAPPPPAAPEPRAAPVAAPAAAAARPAAAPKPVTAGQSSGRGWIIAAIVVAFVLIVAGSYWLGGEGGDQLRAFVREQGWVSAPAEPAKSAP